MEKQSHCCQTGSLGLLTCHGPRELHVPKAPFLSSVLTVQGAHSTLEQKHEDSSAHVLILFIQCLKLGLGNVSTLAASAFMLANQKSNKVFVE